MCHSAIRENISKIDTLVKSLANHHEKEIKDRDVFRYFAVGFFFIATVFIIFYARSSFIKPVWKLRDAAKEIEKMNLDVRVDIKSRDEIGESSRAFNRMAEVISVRDREKNELLKDISRSHKEWQDTFDSITDFVSIHDRDFNIIRANMAVAKYFGLHPRDVINKKCYEVFHGTDSPVAHCPHRMTLDENRPVTKEILDPKTNRIFLVSTFPYYSPDGELLGSVHVAKDISDEREKEMQLIMSERLAALGQMAAGVAHEINNPLAAIAGCAGGLLSRVEKDKYDPELFERYSKIIEEEVLRCKGITNSILSFARKTAYEKNEININGLLDKTLEMIGFQGRLKDIEVVKNYKEEMPVIYESEGELRQAFLTVITNALDAMQDRGILTIETGVEDDKLFIKISDTGHGIPSENRDRIFDPFFTTKSDKGGTGLGLAIARRIITNHNGTIDVISEEGKDTTFKITYMNKMLPVRTGKIKAVQEDSVQTTESMEEASGEVTKAHTT